MTARETFRKGQRVRTTQHAVDVGVVKAEETGTVVGFGRISNLEVRVLLDGRVSPVSYHLKFWVAARGEG